MALSTTTSREILSGKFAAKAMDEPRREAECPTMIGRSHFNVGDDGENVAHIGVDGIVLARAPAEFAEAALVEAGDLAVGGERFRDA